MLAVLAYIDLNGVHAGKFESPGQSQWSSYNAYAHGRKDELIELAPSYMELGKTADVRQAEYRQFVISQIKRDNKNT